MNKGSVLKPQVILRWIIAGMLVLAALSKLANPQEFFTSLNSYKLPLPPLVLMSVAVVLPWLELSCGLLLLGGFRLRPALLWAIILFGVFTITTGMAWARGLEISCGCFNIRWLGFNGRSAESISRFIESPAFACLRALVSMLAAVWLFKQADADCQSRAPVETV